MNKGTPVYLNIYDFTSFNTCLSHCGIGGYHTGIEIKDLEFCFCVIDSDLKATGVLAIEPQSAEYQFNRKLFLGDTYMTDIELEALMKEMEQKYTCGAYHMFKCNCNHFSQELADRLLIKPLPQWIFRSTNILKYLCCCLPTGFVSGQWAFQALEEQMRLEQGEQIQHDLYGKEKMNHSNQKYFTQ